MKYLNNNSLFLCSYDSFDIPDVIPCHKCLRSDMAFYVYSDSDKPLGSFLVVTCINCFLLPS